MKKVLTIEQIRQADQYTIDNEPITSVDLMERAASGCYQWIKDNLYDNQQVMIFCGMGNNGGDGLVIARLFARDNIPVTVCCADHSREASLDFSINFKRLKEFPGINLQHISTEDALLRIPDNTLIIDALLGSGISKPVTGLLGNIIQQINHSGQYVVSIDVPSGLFCDRPADLSGEIIKANITLTFELPKLGYFWPENEKFIGDWVLIKIGLDPGFIDKAVSRHFLLEKPDIAGLLRPRHKFSHKGNFGHGLLISGSYGKMGAAILGAKAALRTGAGLITVHLPGKGYSIMQTALPEAMTSIDESDDKFTLVPGLSNYNAIAVGPGIGTSSETANALKILIQNTTVPLILDADALNILSENKTWLSFLPKYSIITPHIKEFERLTSKTTNSYERNEAQIDFSVKYGLITVLKGAYSCITLPDGRCYYNPTGNPGMATGGSGDVLTGIILGLMAQHYTPAEAAWIGTYIHGLAGDLAVAKVGQHSMIASDIIENLPGTFYHFMEKET